MIRILQCVNKMDRSGLETMLMNYYRNIDRAEIQFDFLTHRPDRGAYDDEIEGLGGKIYHAPRLYPQNYPSYFKWMKTFFEEHPEYRIVHSHIDVMSYFPLAAAKKAGVPIRIAHSHCSSLEMDFKLPIKFFALKRVPGVAGYYCACGEAAGRFLFGKRDFKIIRNAIDLKSFAFEEKIRQKKRRELGIEGKFVIGHVGRYCRVKNQLFLLSVFKEILQNREQSHLLLIGKGKDLAKIQKKVADLGIGKHVSLLIDRSDVSELYQAMDLFVMPSLFEGLPVVGVEAQANGLPCIVSDRISNEMILSENVEMLGLEAGVAGWKDKILTCNTNRIPSADVNLQNAGYDVQQEAIDLKKWYCSLM